MDRRTGSASSTGHPRQPGGDTRTAADRRRGCDSASPSRRPPVPALRALAAPLALAALIGSAGVASAASVGPSHGRHYELATPPEKLGQPTTPSALSPDGRLIRFATTGGNGLPGTGAQYAMVNSYLARRDAHGWGYFPMNLPETQITQGFYFDSTLSLDVELHKAIVAPPTRTTAFFRQRPGLPPERISLDIENRAGVADFGDPTPLLLGASTDLSHVVFSAAAGTSPRGEIAYLPSDPPPDFVDEFTAFSPRKLYESVAGHPPELRRVDVDDSGTPIGGACGGNGLLQVNLGTTDQAERAVSADGRRIFFTTSPDCVDRRVYARIDGTSTVELSAPECDRVADPAATPPVTACEPRLGGEEYQSASTDGEAVWFTSPNQLVDGDVDATSDLYRYDFTAPRGARLHRVSAGTNPAPAGGADLRGMVRMSADGDRAYFVAGAVLTTAANAQGETAVAGEHNLYRHDVADDSMHFVTTLDAAGGDWAVYGMDFSRMAHLADPHGRYLVFASVARLTADDTDSSQDVYRYDAESGRLERASVGQQGFGSNGNDETVATFSALSNQVMKVSAPSTWRIVSLDGRIVFQTSEALQAGDVNGASDIYEWADGEVGLVSDGVTPGGTPDQSGVATRFIISADGSAVTFSTGARLLPDRDTDTANDVYVARLGPDVDPLPSPPPGPCAGDSCQGPSPAAPSGPSIGSLTFMAPDLPSILPRARIAISKPKAFVGAGGVLEIRVPSAGRLSVSGRGLRRATRTVRRGGTHTLRVALTRRAARGLARGRSVTRTARVVFQPSAGTTVTVRQKLTFKASSSRRGR